MGRRCGSCRGVDLVGHITPLADSSHSGADNPALEGVVRRQTIVLVAPLPRPSRHQSAQHSVKQVTAAVVDELALEATGIELNLLRIIATLKRAQDGTTGCVPFGSLFGRSIALVGCGGNSARYQAGVGLERNARVIP